MYNCMFVSALPDPTYNSEKSANGGNKQILLLNIIIIDVLQSCQGHYRNPTYSVNFILSFDETHFLDNCLKLIEVQKLVYNHGL